MAGNALAVAHQRLTPLRGISQTPELAAPNLSRVWALPSAAGYNPYLLERYRTLVSMDPTGPLRLDALSPENTALNILAVRYLFAPALPADSPEAQTLAADPSRWRKIQNLLSGAVYENEGALPRARLVPEVLTVSPSQDLAAIQHSVLPDGRRYDPRTTALVEEPVAFERQQTGSRGTAQIVRDGHTMIEIQVESDSPAFLVLADTYYPGWRASVDGKPAEVLRTDYALRGVAVPRGSHIVQFEYHPAILRAAEVISGLSVLGVLAILGLPLLVRSATGLASVKRRVTSGQAR